MNPEPEQAVLESPALTEANRQDAELVEQCLRGNEDAWCTLIEKYKNLIYSIPIKYGATQDDAADIFQSVSLELWPPEAVVEIRCVAVVANRGQ